MRAASRWSAWSIARAATETSRGTICGKRCSTTTASRRTRRESSTHAAARSCRPKLRCHASNDEPRRHESPRSRTDHEALAALDRAHLVHPVAAWRQHEAARPARAGLGPRRLAHRRPWARAARRLRGALVRERRLWAGERRPGRDRADAQAAVCHGLLRLRQRARDPPRGEARRDHASFADARRI